ncbi:MAG: SdrD B-like domain-containing protein, partial [Acidobacteriota bacterium]
MRDQRQKSRAILLCVALTLLTFGAARAQLGPGPFAAFPSQNATDGRFMGFGCAGLATFEQNVQIALAAPAATATFDLNVFDGETGGLDGAGKRHWDLGTRQLKFSLYADPARTGSTAPANLIGQWFGNAVNPTSGPFWTSSAASMPDNAWWAVTVTNTAISQAPSGNYFYNFVIDTDGPCGLGEQLESSLKIAASNPMNFRTPRFGLVAGLRQLANDVPIIYPGSTSTVPATGSFLTAPTTYDGTFEFYFTLPGGETELRLFDGDFDFGTSLVVGNPSGVLLDPCVDQDDPDTDAAYSGFPFVTTGASPEGIQGPGSPPDDNFRDVFRRGELGDPGHVGCVRYEVTDPEGNVYFNNNPSGSFEWEQFLIATPTSSSAGDADWLYSGTTLPGGIWKVTIVGLDLANLNFWFADTCATRPARAPHPGEDPDEVPRVPACSDESSYILGDFVWADTANPGVLDSGEAGIPGVLMELVRPSDSVVIATAKTGDTTSPNWSACVANNTGTDTNGLYCFGMDSPGSYEVRVAASNFDPGQPLAGKSSTTGGDSLTRTLAGTNVLTYDFGYDTAANASLGDRVWLDPDGDGVQDAGESGINGVTVELLNGANSVIGSQVTSGDGNYTFSGLTAGTYSVRIVTATLPPGLVQTYDFDGVGTANIATASLGAGQNRTDIDFGYRQPPSPGSLGDRVWNDLNGNGAQDVGEPGINGVTVRLLDGTNAVIASQVTAGDGNYTFGNLAAGSYTVVVDSTTLPAGFGPTYDLDGVATPHRAAATLNMGQNRTDVDFGYHVDDTATCAQGSFNNPAYGSNPDGHAFYLPGIGLDFQFAPATGSFVQRADGTARLTGIVRRTADPSQAFVVDVVLSGFTATAPPGSPKKELSASAYSENGGPVNTATFKYYTSFTGELTGIESFAGAVVNIANTGPAFQLGAGANNKNLLYGGSGWFLWNVASQPAGGSTLTPSGQGDINIDLGDCSACVNHADSDPAVLGGGYNHALWLPGIGTDFQFSPLNGTFVRNNADGTAHLTGTVYSLSSPTHGFQVDIQFSGFTATTPPGSPKKELAAGAYVENGGVADSATWTYYTAYSGTLTGVSAYAGGSISISKTGPAFQMGVGANNKNLHFGASGWYLWQVNSQPTGGEVLVSSGQGDINLDMFDCPPVSYGSVGDRIWNDTNGDGIQDAGEVGINGVTVRLVDTLHNVTIGTQVTAGDGNYTFGNVLAGSYRIEVVPATLPAGLAPTYDLDGVGTANSASFALAAGQNRADVDFGYRGTASVGDRVWTDTNGNGVQDAGETGINGVTVELLNSGGTVIASQATAGDGNYSFTNLSAGNYSVRVVAATLPPGLTQTYDLDGFATANIAAFALAGGQNRTDVDFGYRGTASVGDRVWTDTNANGVQDAGEVGINGVTVELLNSGGTVIASKVTAGDGNYIFTNLLAGNYSVRVVTSTLPAGLAQTFDLDGVGTANIAAFTLAGGQNRTDVDFGYRGTASVGDRVWTDTNANGLQDAGEVGINGATVELLNSGGTVIASKVTSGDGNYSFTSLLAGNYSVRVVTATLPAGMAQTFDLDGIATANIATFNLAAGQNRTDVDFGYRGTASAGDRVWTDTNGNGVQDSGETGINGVTVELLSSGGTVLASKVTSGDGNYSFTNLLPANYSVRVVTSTLPAGVAQTYDLDGTGTANIASFALAAGQNRTDVDFGYRVPPTGSIGDRVWNDVNGNGVQDAGEVGLNGVTVRLLNAANTVIATQVTATNGNYTFTGLMAGTYTVVVDSTTLPPGFGPTYDLDGVATPHRAVAILTAGQARTDVDFGYRTSDSETCAKGAYANPTYSGATGGHAFWLPNIGTDFMFAPATGSFVQHADGTARLTGVIRRIANPSQAFIVDVVFSGFTMTPPPMSPKKEMLASAYSENGGPVNTATFKYYATFTGKLTGIETFAGAVINLTPAGPAFQIGIGANNKNILYGGSGWFLWTVASQPTSGTALSTTGQGDINVDLGNCASCANEANNNPAVQSVSANHVLWLPGIGTDFQFSPIDGTFVRNADGTAHLTGTMYSVSAPTHGFTVDLTFAGYTATAGAGSPKKELAASAYSQNGGPVNTASWNYYKTFTGTLKGVSAYAGASITITNTGPAFQMGVGANNKNLNFGGSGWYLWNVTSQPTSGSALTATGQGDINLDVLDCPTISYGSIGNRV